MKTEIDILHLRNVRLKLKIWGSWYRQMLVWGLGYSNNSLLYRLIKQGNVVRSTKTVYGPENKEAEEINDLIDELGKEKPNWAKILMIQYAEEMTVKQKILYARVVKRTYFYYLQKAESWILSKIY